MQNTITRPNLLERYSVRPKCGRRRWLNYRKEKLEQAKSLGADFAINYKTELEWGRKVKEITGSGADHIIEVGGAGTLEQSIKAIRPFGQISLIGILAGGAKDLNLLPVLMNNIKLQ